MSRAMRKKIVFLPYDFDTAIGINNEGSLVFSYNLEDIDQTAGGADVFNGQQSVLWKNLREMFPDELRTMFQSLRSTGALSYAKVEKMFEDHQGKWPEAIFNEDAWFKYLAPLEEKGSAAYLAMLQGSKAEQRKFWIYNRFRYLDSKYNAGDSLTDVITLRGYAKANITLTPYADVYATVKYGSYLVQTRAQRNHSYEMVCPLDNVNDTEIYIYSASQLADVGDLSPLKVGYAEFVYATKLQNLKLGDSSPSYSNGNLQTLYLGQNKLLKTLDVRNCAGLGTGDQKTVDLSGCTGIEEVYFDGTVITGVSLPNGGVLRKLHVPGTITSLIIRNQPSLSELVCPSYTYVSTLWLENTGNTVNTLNILKAVNRGTRVRLFGFSWQMTDSDDVTDLIDTLDSMRGLDQNGDNVASAQVYGTIHVGSVTGATITLLHESYPDISVTYDHVSAALRYYDNDGTLLASETILDGSAPASTPNLTTKEDTRYTYTFLGWSSSISGSVEQNILNNIQADTDVYAVYSRVEKVYTVRFYNGTTLLQTFTNVAYGESVTYDTVPTYSGPGNVNDYVFSGWSPSPQNITGDTDCYAQYTFTGVYFRSFLEGTMASYEDDNNITTIGDMTFAGMESLTYVSMPALTVLPKECFTNDKALEEVSLPEVLALNCRSFASNRALTVIRLPKCTIINENPAIYSCSNLKEVRLPANTSGFSGAITASFYIELLDLGVVATLTTDFTESIYDDLETLILRNASQVCNAKSATMFRSSSPLKAGTGLILVPRALVASYKADSKWSGYASMIEAIEDHPELCS